MQSRDTFTALDYKILEVLVDFIKDNVADPKSITYKELVERVNDPAVIPINMGRYLGRIGRIVDATANLTHAPIPNSIVVNQSSDMAGDGYDELMKSMGKSEPSIQAIYDYKKWDLILDLAKGSIGKLI